MINIQYRFATDIHIIMVFGIIVFIYEYDHQFQIQCANLCTAKNSTKTFDDKPYKKLYNIATVCTYNLRSQYIFLKKSKTKSITPSSL